jgi:hypothetical protein
MAELSQAARNYVDDMSRQPAARAPATMGEIWDSEWKRGGLDTITGVGEPLRNATDELRNAITAASGKSLEDYAAERRVPLTGATVDQRIKALNDLADTLPDEAKATVDPLRDVRRRAAQNAQKIERDAAQVSASTFGLGGIATSWAAGVARQTTDPVNLALMGLTAPIGGPVTGSAAKFIGGQFIAGAASQAAVEPYIEPARAELGLEAGLGRAATNIFEAGLGGAALGAAGFGLHRLFRAAADSYRTQADVGVQADPQRITPEDFDALAMQAERNAVTTPPAADPVSHAAALKDAALAIEEGRPIQGEASPAVIRGDEYTASPEVDLNVVGNDVVSRVQTALENGSKVIYHVEDRPVEITSIVNGMMADASGQRWGVMQLLSPTPGKRTEIEISGQAAPALLIQDELPLARPIEPKGPPAEVKEPVDVIGDPILAQDVEHRLSQMDGNDFVVHIEQPDKTIKAGSAKAILREIQDDANAVKELIDCLGQEPK